MPPHRGNRGRQRHNPTQLPCTFTGCSRLFKNVSGCTQHFRAHHHAQAATHSERRSPLLNRNSVPADAVGDILTTEGSSTRQPSPSTFPHFPEERGSPPLNSPVQSPIFHPSTPGYSPPPSPQHFPQPIHPEPVSRVYHPLINGKSFLTSTASLFRPSDPLFRETL